MKIYFTCLAPVIWYFHLIITSSSSNVNTCPAFAGRKDFKFLDSFFCPWDGILYKEYTEQLNQNKQKLKEKSMQNQHFWQHRIKPGTFCYSYIKGAFNEHATERKSSFMTVLIIFPKPVWYKLKPRFTSWIMGARKYISGLARLHLKTLFPVQHSFERTVQTFEMLVQQNTAMSLIFY